MNCEIKSTRPSLFGVVLAFATALLAWLLLSRLGVIGLSPQIGSSVGFVSALVIGLAAGTSTCLAVSGGLMLSATSSYAANRRLAPIASFLGARVVSYAFLGGVIGFLGKEISLGSGIQGIISILVAVFMVILGLDMLGILPRALKVLLPRPPAFLGRKILSSGESKHPLAPFVLGAATFFLPCGFTQALQLYALGSGSFVAGATVLGGFALGTVPVLLLVGWFSVSFKKSEVGRFLFRTAGAAAILVGAFSVRSGINLIITQDATLAKPAEVFVQTGSDKILWQTDAPPTDSSGFDTIRMTINANGYSPDRIQVTAGHKIRWVVDASRASGCQMGLVSKSLGLKQFLNTGENIIEFTAPSQAGIYPFSCPMGMYRGDIVVN